MARAKSVTREALAALGAGVLAGVLVAHAEGDPVLHRKLSLLLAGNQGAGKLAAGIEKRIRTIGRSRSFINAETRRPLLRELEHLRAMIATQLAARDPERAIELMWRFLEVFDPVLERMGDGFGNIEEIFGAALEDLGRLSAASPPCDPEAVARRVLAFCDRGGIGGGGALIQSMAAALGEAGLAEIRSKTEAALKALPQPQVDRDWKNEARRRRLASRLALLGDIGNDMDGFIAAIRAGGMEGTHALEVARHVIAAGRPGEALGWLDAPRRRFEAGGRDETEAELRIEALEALGRGEEAQMVRWRRFEQVLSVGDLRAYLKRLPDFDDFEAEQKALDRAARHERAERALAFFIEWRALDRADALVRARLGEMDGRLYEVLRPAAEALAERYPEAARLLYRRLVESVLERGSSKQYPCAARDLRSDARLPEAGRAESHGAFTARLRKAHGRKCGFWELVEPKER